MNIPELPKSGNDFSIEQKDGDFENTSSPSFALMYPVIAEQILERTGKRSGIALELGSGPAHLAIAVAQHSDLMVIAFDKSPLMLGIAEGHIGTADLIQKVVPVLGDVHTLPCKDGTIELVFSRGSWFFWKDMHMVFQEIYRILAPDGIAYIGGGFGNSHLKKKISTAMNEKNHDFEKGEQERIQKNSPDNVRNKIDTSTLKSYEIIHDKTGFWIIMKQ